MAETFGLEAADEKRRKGPLEESIEPFLFHWKEPGTLKITRIHTDGRV